MPDALHILPDAVFTILQYLRARSEVTALAPSANIVSQMPTVFSGSYITVTLAGSAPIWPHLDEASLQVDVMITGPIEGTEAQNNCSILARTVRAAMWAIRNDIVNGVVMSGCVEEVGPQWMPDLTPTLPVARFTARYRVLLHP